MFKSGYIAIVGRPNVGKSTFLNALLGQKIAAVSPKPQMTRRKILGIKHSPSGQILFLDTPGLHVPHRNLNELMVEEAHRAVQDADVILFMMDASEGFTEEDQKIANLLFSKGKPIIIVLNKMDRVPVSERNIFMERCRILFSNAPVLPLAALQGQGLEDVEKEILEKLSEGPAYYPEDQVSDQTERFLVSEIIREKIMDLTQEEIPYSVTVVVEAFKEPKEEDVKKVVRIRASIITEKDSQKGILIGKGGQMIKKIGEESRKDIETQLEQKVFLELFVRVEKDWTKDPSKLKEFGYE